MTSRSASYPSCGNRVSAWLAESPACSALEYPRAPEQPEYLAEVDHARACTHACALRSACTHVCVRACGVKV